MLQNSPFPSRRSDEQWRIVGILNRAAKIERLRARAQERLRDFIPALFGRMFGGENPDAKHWPVYRVDQMLKDGRRSIRNGTIWKSIEALRIYRRRRACTWHRQCSLEQISLD